MPSSNSLTQLSPQKSQYHHSVPRFILRNFSHPPKIKENGAKRRRQKNGKKRGGYKKNESMLYTLDLSGSTAKITEAAVSRTLGELDLYRDLTALHNQHNLETQLSKLESNAAVIIRKIQTRFEEKCQDARVSRSELETLRKFLFIMKYRTSHMGRRFRHEDAEDYSSDDREHLLEYMRQKGFKKPIEVWFHNIKAILELKMGPTVDWAKELTKSAYFPDALWFITHMKDMYMALCTPSGLEDEFLLTENCYGIHEGPASIRMDLSTGKEIMTGYTEYHVFAVISPTLMIVLRSNLLPNREEDRNEVVREFRRKRYELCASKHNFPEDANSILADLPISKARNSYTKVVDGSLELLDGEDRRPRVGDWFCFQFFPITTEHVNKINAVMLEESYKISTVVFYSSAGLRKTLEYFLTSPSYCGSQSVSGKPNDPRLVLLAKLEQAAHDLGSSIPTIHQKRVDVLREGKREELLDDMAGRNLPEKPVAFMQFYQKLGGSYATVLKDMDQGRKMLNMRIKFDLWSRGLQESVRNDIRENLRAVFCQLPAPRVWFYLKFVQNIVNGNHTPNSITLGGPEDILAKASQLIRSHDIARLMYSATHNNIELARHPDFDLYAYGTFDALGFARFEQSKIVAFSSLGSICDCAIDEVEQKARSVRDRIQVTGVSKSLLNPFLTEDENIEMFTRVETRSCFSNLLRAKLDDSDLQALEEVIFQIVYPSGTRRNTKGEAGG